MYNVYKYSKTWRENDDISIYRYRTGTGNKFNLIIRMAVYKLSQPIAKVLNGLSEVRETAENP